MERVYQIASKKDSRQLAEFLAQNGQALLPMVDLIEQAQMAVDDFIDVLGRAALEAVLQLSAEQLAGPPHQGKAAGEVRRHGSQSGTGLLVDAEGAGEQAALAQEAWGSLRQDAFGPRSGQLPLLRRQRRTAGPCHFGREGGCHRPGQREAPE